MPGAALAVEPQTGWQSPRRMPVVPGKRTPLPLPTRTSRTPGRGAHQVARRACALVVDVVSREEHARESLRPAEVKLLDALAMVSVRHRHGVQRLRQLGEDDSERVDAVRRDPSLERGWLEADAADRKLDVTRRKLRAAKIAPAGPSASPDVRPPLPPPPRAPELAWSRGPARALAPVCAPTHWALNRPDAISVWARKRRRTNTCVRMGGSRGRAGDRLHSTYDRARAAASRFWWRGASGAKRSRVSKWHRAPPPSQNRPTLPPAFDSLRIRQ